MEPEFIDKIVEKCMEVYKKLPKTGKPSSTEWTTLSSVIKIESNKHLEVVSIGTGTKCIGATKMSGNGYMLNDCHSEVMARRGFLLYLYDHADKAFDGQKSIFEMEDNKCKLKDGVEFAFYSSQLPCGDASIIPKNGDEDQFGDVIKTRKRKIESESSDVTKGDEVVNDIHRTGAKCLPEDKQDPKGIGADYHLLGQVRTKPGRGDRTLSVSCSDKIARWIHLGIQGSLLDMLLLKPIYINHFIFGANVPYSEESLNRALLYRNNKRCDVKINCIPKFYQCSVEFMSTKNDERNKPTPGSIVWINLSTSLMEVAIQGKKLGTTKKNKDNYGSCLCISKAALFLRFSIIFQKNKHILDPIFADITNMADFKYDNIKSRSKKYFDRWKLVKENIFKTWTVKPKIWDFSAVSI